MKTGECACFEAVFHSNKHCQLPLFYNSLFMLENLGPNATRAIHFLEDITEFEISDLIPSNNIDNNNDN